MEPEGRECTPDKLVLRDKVKKLTRGKIISLVIGIIFVATGTFSSCYSDELNAALIEVGVAKSVHDIIETDPQARDYILKIADLIDAGIAAKQASPQRLVTILSQDIEQKRGQTIPGIKAITHVIVSKLFDTHKTSATEQEYINKLRHLVAGMRDGARQMPGIL